MTVTLVQMEALSGPAAWDPRLEKYGWPEYLVNFHWDYGVSFSIAQNEYNREVMVVEIENAHMLWPESVEKLPVRGIKVEVDAGAGTVKIVMPERHVLAGFGVVMGALTPDLKIVEKKTLGGLFSFHILHIDYPNDVAEFKFRSGYNDADVTRREAARFARRQAVA